MIIETRTDEYRSAIAFLSNEEWYSQLGEFIKSLNNKEIERAFISFKLSETDKSEILDFFRYELLEDLCDEDIIRWFLDRDKRAWIITYIEDRAYSSEGYFRVTEIIQEV